MFSPRVSLRTMIALASASLGLVAALARNDAIRATLRRIPGTGDSLIGPYTYAILATLLAVVVVVLGRAAARVGGESLIEREAEG